MSYMTHLLCLNCGCTIEPYPFRYTCPDCGGYLDVQYDYERMKSAVKTQDFDSRRGSILQQWLPLLPIEKPELVDRVTLGEAPSPLLHTRNIPGIGANTWLKNDSLMPTASLKDRSLPITIVKGLEFGYQSVGIVSSGNASASLAAYAARAGVQCIVFLKESIKTSKLYKTMIYKPLAIQVRAQYDVAENLFQQARDEFGFFDCDGVINPYRIEGKKTFAYEVARDMDWKAPAAVFMPTGYGNGIVAVWKGFKELHRLGFIDSLPAMIAVQPAVCAPIARAFHRGLSYVEPIPSETSVAEAVSVNDPNIAGVRVLEAVRESGGTVLTAEEDEIRMATRLLAEKEGLAIEPTGAVAVAGLIGLERDGNPWAGGVNVVSITGHGLNVPEDLSTLISPPHLVDPDYRLIQKIFTHKDG